MNSRKMGVSYAAAGTLLGAYSRDRWYSSGNHRGSHKLSSQVHTKARKAKQKISKASRKANR